MFDIVSWKCSLVDYRLQVDNLTTKMREKFLRMFSDWKVVGEVFPAGDGKDFGLILARNFADKTAWLVYCRNFEECPIYGYGNDEKGADASKILLNKRKWKKILMEMKQKPVNKTKKKRICSRCGGVGHNTRTCREPRK